MSIFTWVKSLFVNEIPKPKKEKPVKYVWENPQLQKKAKRFHRNLKNVHKRRHYKAKHTNPCVKKFIDQELVFDPECKTSYFELYNVYVTWCVKKYGSFLSYQGFFRSLHYHCRNKTIYKSEAKGKEGAFLNGVGFRKDQDEQLFLGI